MVLTSVSSILFTLELHSQVIISGKILDYNNEPISSVQIIISEIGSKEVSQFDISDIAGKFQISIRSNMPELVLKTRHLSFSDTVIQFQNKPQAFIINLRDKVTSLDEILIKFNSPIKKSGDTISYKVDDVRSKNDEKIKDILKKLPGIEVTDNGRILFNNEPINHYYIEGLDLLGDKYNLANDNISSDLVDEIQVLENHQPIRILEEVTFSRSAAINIRLKNKAVIQNTVNGGVGYLKDVLWEAGVTNLIFRKKDQAINTYQSNNIGKDLYRQLNSLTVEELIEAINIDFIDQKWLDISTLNNPLLSPKRWMDNKSHLATMNYIKKRKAQTTLKGNISYLHNNLVQKGNKITQYTIPNETIILNENQNNAFTKSKVDVSFTLSKNKKNRYLRNSLESTVSWGDAMGIIQFSDSLVAQSLPIEYVKTINKFKWIHPFEDRLLTINSLMGFEHLSNELSISTNPFGIEKETSD